MLYAKLNDQFDPNVLHFAYQLRPFGLNTMIDYSTSSVCRPNRKS